MHTHQPKLKLKENTHLISTFPYMTCTHAGIMTVGTLPPVTADGNDGYVIKFGPNGTPTWTTTVTGQGYQALARIAVQMDGTFYAVVSGEW